jgi:hypothetical protein
MRPNSANPGQGADGAEQNASHRMRSSSSTRSRTARYREQHSTEIDVSMWHMCSNTTPQICP